MTNLGLKAASFSPVHFFLRKKAPFFAKGKKWEAKRGAWAAVPLERLLRALHWFFQQSYHLPQPGYVCLIAQEARKLARQRGDYNEVERWQEYCG